MSTIKLQFPKAIGAVNVHVTDSAGSVVAEQQLLTGNPTDMWGRSEHRRQHQRIAVQRRFRMEVVELEPLDET